MKAHADFARGGNFRIDQFRLAAGKEIMMVRGRRAAGEQQFRHTHQGGHMHGFFIQARPQGIKRAKPVEEFHVGGGGAGARQRLAEMVVGVDQSRQGHRISSADRAVGAQPRGWTLAHLLDFPALGVNESAAQNGVVRIHRNHRVDVADEQGWFSGFRLGHG